MPPSLGCWHLGCWWCCSYLWCPWWSSSTLAALAFVLAALCFFRLEAKHSCTIRRVSIAVTGGALANTSQVLSLSFLGLSLCLGENWSVGLSFLHDPQNLSLGGSSASLSSACSSNVRAREFWVMQFVQLLRRPENSGIYGALYSGPLPVSNRREGWSSRGMKLWPLALSQCSPPRMARRSFCDFQENFNSAFETLEETSCFRWVSRGGFHLQITRHFIRKTK